MKSKKILIVSSVAATVLTAGFAGTMAMWPNAPSYAAGMIARQAHSEASKGGHGHGWGHGGGHGGWGRHGRGGGVAMLCSDRRDRHIERGIGFVEGFANFTPEQMGPWNQLTAAIRAGSTSIGEACNEALGAEAPQTAPEKLDRVETVMATALELVRRIRPAFDNFYAALSDKQKKALDGLVGHHRRS